MQWLKSKIDRFRRGESTKLDLRAHYAPSEAAHRLTEFPLEILELENLTELDLSNSDIKTIPEEIIRLECLETPSLRLNRHARLPRYFAQARSVGFDTSAGLGSICGAWLATRISGSS